MTQIPYVVKLIVTKNDVNFKELNIAALTMDTDKLSESIQSKACDFLLYIVNTAMSKIPALANYEEILTFLGIIV